MTFRAVPHPRRFWLWLGVAGGGLVLAGVFLLLARADFSPRVYVGWLVWGAALILFAMYAYRVWALDRLRYTVTRDALRIRWGVSTFVVPMAEVGAVRNGRVEGAPDGGAWWRWPALYVGRDEAQPREWILFSTCPPEQTVYLCGPRLCVGLSPQDSARFVEAINRRRALGPNRSLAIGWEHPRVVRWRLWQDSWALAGLLVSLVMVILLWGEAAMRPEFPRMMRLARLGTLLLLLNWAWGALLYVRERVLALALWWGGSLVLVILLLGLWMGGV